MKRNLRVGLYVGAWPQNIGNAFFDLGARAILQKAIPEATFYPMGGAVHWMFRASEKQQNGPIKNRINELLNIKQEFGANSFEIGEYAEVDLIVFAGMSMCREFVENNGRTLIEASKRGVAILGLGAGGALYDDDEVVVYSDFFRKLHRAAIITRDDDTYNMFSGHIQNLASGIDCAFFLPEYYTPPRLVLPSFDIENFDSLAIHPVIDHGGRKVLFTHHDLWGHLPKKYINKPGTLVSDVPEDYLTLYAQVTETYADRVHACVASLAYGNRARLFSETPRKALFSKVGVPNVTREVSQIDMDFLADLKAKQVKQARSFIEMLIP